MNNTKLLGLTAGVSSLVLASSAMADFQGISWTNTLTSEGMVYQIFADIDAGGQLNAVYGDNVVALSINSDLGFYQNAFGSATVAGMNPAFFPMFPSLMNDSFVTIGLSDNVGNAMLDIGIDFTAFEAGGAITTSNGSWFATPDDAQVYEVGGKVMIGQFTVADGDHVFGTINMQGKNSDGTNWTAANVSFDTAPAPGALALLGIAGLATRRRRK